MIGRAEGVALARRVFAEKIALVVGASDKSDPAA